MDRIIRGSAVTGLRDEKMTGALLAYIFPAADMLQAMIKHPGFPENQNGETLATSSYTCNSSQDERRQT